MDSFVYDPVITLIALLVASGLGGVIGFILRGWYDESRPPADRRERARGPAPEARPGVRRVEPPAATRLATPWDGAGSGDLAGPVTEHGEEGRPLVLLVDDRLELLALHSSVLHRSGYAVLTAADGEAALELARDRHPEVIVLDHSMPRRTGLEVARELKQDPATADIPIIMMTAHSYGAIGVAAREAGCETFLPKPVEPSRMLREVSALLESGGALAGRDG